MIQWVLQGCLMIDEVRLELTQDSIQQRLTPRPVRFYERADSTNDLALEWLRAGAPSGAAVIADEQVKGRGRLGRYWHTPPGVALAVSVVLRPTAAQVPEITMLGALAVYDTLVALGVPDLGIKWPNDVQVQGRKVCGVLPEAVWGAGELAGVVLGLGLNVRVDFSGTELEGVAVSIETALGRPVSRLDVLALLLGEVDTWYARLGQSVLFATWKNRLTTLGRRITVNELHGLAEAVDDSGSLLLRDADGRLHRIVAGDIALGDGG